MKSRYQWKSIQPIAVLFLGMTLAAVGLLTLFPAQGMDMDAQATLQCPPGYIAVEPAQIAGQDVQRIDQPLQTPQGERVCIVPPG